MRVHIVFLLLHNAHNKQRLNNGGVNSSGHSYCCVYSSTQQVQTPSDYSTNTNRVCRGRFWQKLSGCGQTEMGKGNHNNMQFKNTLQCIHKRTLSVFNLDILTERAKYNASPMTE